MLSMLSVNRSSSVSFTASRKGRSMCCPRQMAPPAPPVSHSQPVGHSMRDTNPEEVGSEAGDARVRGSHSSEEGDEGVAVVDAADRLVQRRHDERRVLLQLLRGCLLLSRSQVREPAATMRQPISCCHACHRLTCQRRTECRESLGTFYSREAVSVSGRVSERKEGDSLDEHTDSRRLEGTCDACG